MTSPALVWFRRDLRCHDHAALYHALVSHPRVFCAFVFDTEILDALPGRADRRVEFIWRSLLELDGVLRNRGGGLIVRHGRASEEVPRLAVRLGVEAVYANRDYEPAAIERDRDVAARLAGAGIAFFDFKDQVIFERDEVLTRDGRPFSVFTPYRNAWRGRLETSDLQPYPVERHFDHLAASGIETPVPSLEQIGFQPTDLAALGVAAGMSGARMLFDDFAARIDAYKKRRDFPALQGTSCLSVHLRFGTISVRELAAFARQRGGPDLHITASQYYLNISLRRADKGTAIDELLEMLGVRGEQAGGIGDTEGDLPLRRRVGWFACPSNASAAIKAVADYVSPHGDALGVLDILEQPVFRAGS